jgi:hypothetical protein
MLVQERADKAERKAAMEGMIQNGPQPILIPRELVPEEYWNGVPQTLKLLLDGLSDRQQIIGTILAYHSAEQARKQSEQNLATMKTNNQRLRNMGAPPVLTSEEALEEPFRRVEELNRKLAEQYETPYEANQRDNAMRDMRIRFVPASVISRLQGMPGLPVLPFQETQPFPQGFQPTPIQKGNP